MAFYRTLASESWLVLLLSCICVYVQIKEVNKLKSCRRKLLFSKSSYQIMKGYIRCLLPANIECFSEITITSSDFAGAELHSHGINDCIGLLGVKPLLHDCNYLFYSVGCKVEELGLTCVGVQPWEDTVCQIQCIGNTYMYNIDQKG